MTIPKVLSITVLLISQEQVLLTALLQLYTQSFKTYKNGSPGGLRGQIQAEGADVQGGHFCLVLFPLIREAPRQYPESSTVMSRETEKGLRGKHSRAPTSKLKITNMLPPFLTAPQAQGSHGTALWSTQAHPEAPHPDSHHFISGVGRMHL